MIKKNKYRAWDKTHKEYVLEPTTELLDGYLRSNGDLDKEQIIFLQNTGMEDKWDNEIFVGDILLIRLPGGQHGIVKIEYNAPSFRLMPVNDEEEDINGDAIHEAEVESWFYNDYWTHCQIIGNIYEDQHLVEVKK